MYKYAQLDDVANVIGVSDLAFQVNDPKLIPITDAQYANKNIFICYYADGVIEGYYTKLTTNKIDNSLLADGIDTMTITVEVYDYQDVFQNDWNGIITLDIDGVTKDLDVVNGVASTTFKASVADTYLVKTVKGNFRNAEIEVTAQ